MPQARSDDALAKRNALVLACAQSVGGASPAIVVSLGGIVGQTIAADKTLATLPVSLYNLGLAIGTLPAAAVMRRIGRRNAYLIGAGIGIAGAALAATAVSQSAFFLFCLATFVCGFYGSYVQSYRFAAADGASPAFRSRAISWVMTGGLAAAVIGPQTVIWTRDLVPGALFAGAFLAQAGLALASIAILVNLRPTPVPVAPPTGGRSLGEIARQPRFVAALVAGVVSYGLMTFLMTAAPVAMIGCGHSVGEAALGIQWHVLAMYGPSFFTGRLIERWGKERVAALGVVLIGVASAVALTGTSVAHFWVVLVVLGFGWNLGFIGATALVTDCHRPEERTRVQALNDFLVFGCVAVASFSSGGLLNAGGWDTLNWIVFGPVAAVLALLGWQARRAKVAVPG
jgi:predicted MFS family arabinose efflux permease